MLANVATEINVNMSMSGDGIIEEVVAIGTYVANTVTAQERDASAVLDSIGAEQFARFGDSNAASALKRVAQMMDAQHIDASPVLYVGTLNKQANTDDKLGEYPKNENGS